MHVPSLSLEHSFFIVLPHLGSGGAQKVALLAAEHYERRGVEVVVVTFLPDKPLAHRLPDEVEWIGLGSIIRRRFRNRHPLVWAYRQAWVWCRRMAASLMLSVAWPWLRELQPGRLSWLVDWTVASVAGPHAEELAKLIRARRPRRVLSLLSRTNVLCCQACWSLDSHLVISERNDPALQRLPYPWPRLQSWLWSRADFITANTEGVLEGLRHQHHAFADRLRLLPNPLPSGAMTPSSPSARDAKTCFLAVCRLVHQKGMDLLIAAYAEMPQALRSEWPLCIVGDGPQRQALEQQVEALQLVDAVLFMGFQADPSPFLQRDAIFLLPSRFEGMPNALLEAMAAGLPVVVSDASPGPLEVVRHGENGLVVAVENVKALTAAMRALVEDPSARYRLGASAQLTLQFRDWRALASVWDAALLLG